MTQLIYPRPVQTTGTALPVSTAKSVERGRPTASRPDELGQRLAAWPHGRKQKPFTEKTYTQKPSAVTPGDRFF